MGYLLLRSLTNSAKTWPRITRYGTLIEELPSRQRRTIHQRHVTCWTLKNEDSALKIRVG